MLRHPGNAPEAVALLLFVALLLTLSTANAQQVSVTSELSASTITRDETVMLTIRAVGIDAELDASALDADFDVLGRSSSREVRNTISAEGAIQNISIVTWTLELMPRDVGVFTVPAVSVGPYETQLETLTVNEIPQGAQRDIFVEASVNEQNPWVQSQVLLTVKVFQAVNIVDGGLDVPATDSITLERLGEDISSREIRDGREYAVTTRRFALFPQKSGRIELEPVTLRVTVPTDTGRVRGFFAPTRKLTRRSDRIRLDVKPRPPGGGQWWLPATQVVIDSQFSSSPDGVRVDTPVTRTIRLQVDGVSDTQLPDLVAPTIDGVSLYAEDPQRETNATDRGLVATQQIDWALIPQRSGVMTLPSISVEWFNTMTGRYETAYLPEQQINVTGPASNASANEGAGGRLNPQPAAPEAIAPPDFFQELTDPSLSGLQGDRLPEGPSPPQIATQPETASSGNLSAMAPSDSAMASRLDELESSVTNWRRFALLALFLWLGTLLYYFRASGSRFSLPSLPGAKKSLQVMASDVTGQARQALAPLSGINDACLQGDPVLVKEELLAWGLKQWPEARVMSLRSLAERLPESPARQSVLELDAAVYGQGNASDAEPLQTGVLQRLPEELKSVAKQYEAQNPGARHELSSRSGPSAEAGSGGKIAFAQGAAGRKHRRSLPDL